MERLRRALPLLAALCALIALVLCPDTAASSARAGLKLCAEMLVPSLLPFFICRFSSYRGCCACWDCRARWGAWSSL